MKVFNSEIEVFKNADLKNFCTFKIGGKAKFLFIVRTISALNNVYLYCVIHNILVKVIGFGANLLYDDNGFDGAIIVNKTNKILFRKDCVYADSGVAVSSLISACAERCLGGIENLAGIPSTIGGAVVNGLGAFGVEFNNFVEYVVYLNEKGKIIKLKNSACKFGYRTSIFKQKNSVILRVKLKLSFCDKLSIKTNMLSALTKKSATQPLNYPSAGSVFKRFFLENKIENNNSYNDKTYKKDNLTYDYNNMNKLYKIDKNNNCNDYKNIKNDKKEKINLSYDYNDSDNDNYNDSYKDNCEEKIKKENANYYNNDKNKQLILGNSMCDYNNSVKDNKSNYYNKNHNEKLTYSKNHLSYDYNDCYKDIPTFNNDNQYFLNNLNNKSYNKKETTNKLVNSTLQNYQEIVPAKIIDELGLKGLSVGGAMVSTKHAGFIINTGNATSSDVLNLIKLINQKVLAAYGFTLPLEIEIVKN